MSIDVGITTTRRVMRTAAVYLAWFVAGGLLGLSTYLRAQPYLPEDLPLVQFMWSYIISYATSWLFWPLIQPLVMRLCERFPIDREHWRRAVLVMIAVLLITAVVHSAFQMLVGVPIWMFLTGAPMSRVLTGYTWPDVTLVNAPMALLGFAILVGIGHARLFADRARQRALQASRLETDLTKSQLATLRYKIQPHFLFNALHSVAWMVQERDRTDAIRMITKLSGLLRSALDDTGEFESQLQDELKRVEEYISIEQIRFSDRLTYSIDQTGEIGRALVPTFLLQPIVENGIRHGIERSESGGRLEIRAERRGDDLVLSVECRLSGDIAASRHNGVGHGTEAVEERLRRLYGAAASYRIEESNNGRTVAIVRLPYHTVPVLEE